VSSLGARASGREVAFSGRTQVPTNSLSTGTRAGSHRGRRRDDTVDAYGNVKYGDPSYSVGEDGRIVEVDPYGNKQHHKPQYVIRKDRMYETDSYGRVKQQKLQIPKTANQREGSRPCTKHWEGLLWNRAA
jgi:hypothetical protein